MVTSSFGCERRLSLRSTIAAPDLPPGPRSALIIATAAYADPELRQLRAPAQDAAALAGVLGDRAIGGFAITSVIDQDEPTIRRAVARFLDGRDTGELVLVYLSCHGLLDARGRLFFAATDTERDLLSATAVESTWLMERLKECRARQQVVILDCCFSGAFARRKGTVDLGHRLGGPSRGRVVLTASRDGEYSFEGEPLPGSQAAASVFTAGLVEGLETGAADANHDGLVSVEDAYDYAAHYVREHKGAQTPQKWMYAAEGSIVLARNPAGRVITPVALPQQITVSLDSGNKHVRVGAVRALGEFLSGPDPALALAAQEALELVAEQDRPEVAAISREILEAARAGDDGPGEARLAPATIGTGPASRRESTRSQGAALMATASDDMTARTWNATTGILRTTFKGHEGRVNGVAFSPHGALIATASSDGTARIWDTTTGQVHATLTGHKGRVNRVAFSPDGTLIATTSWDKTARIWDTATGTLRATLTGHEDAVFGTAFSPDGTLIATTSWDKTARTWDAATGTLRATFTGHEGTVSGVAFSPDGTLIATASYDGTARTWDTATGTLRATFTGHQGTVHGVAFSPDGTLIATASYDGTARTWDTATGTLRATLTGHNDWVRDVAFSPTAPGRYGATTYRGTIRPKPTESQPWAEYLLSEPNPSTLPANGQVR